MHSAIKLLFAHVVTFGISEFDWIGSRNQAGWVQFFSDPTYMPHLRSVLTDVQASSLSTAYAFEKVLEDRGVAFKGVTDNGSTFVPIKLLRWDALEVSRSYSSNDSMLISSLASKCFPSGLRASSA